MTQDPAVKEPLAPEAPAPPAYVNLVLSMDQKEKVRLVDLAKTRYLRSVAAYGTKMDSWVRFYKIWRSIKDSVLDSDEPNSFLPYAYGIIAHATSKITEPLFKLRPPCKVKPKHLNDGKSAENFSNYARAYLSSSEYQIDFTSATTERAITGSSWEKDEQLNEWEDGFEWKMTDQKGVMDSIKSFLGKVIPMKSEVSFKGRAKVSKKHPVRVGYHTTFPSVFEVFPEPGIKKVRDMHWIVHEVGEVALQDLEKQMYRDPSTNELKPVYDLSEVYKAAGRQKDGKRVEGGSIIQPQRTWAESNRGEIVKIATGNQDQKLNDAEAQDIDKLWLVEVWERGKMWTVANGSITIRCVDKPLHRPALPFRIRRYSMDPQGLYGIGAIEPVEDVIYEINDVHNLSMGSWIRIVNRMMAVHIDAVPFPDDFKPRSGGKIRVRASHDVRSAIMAIEQSDPSASMLAMESNNKGMVEWATGVQDFSPGTDGTKQDHKTLGGLLEIESAIAKRVATIIRMDLMVYQEQMESMEAFFTQFQFEKIPIRVYSEDGATASVEMNMDDIYTDGRGFDYIIDVDPSYGDDSVQRNQNMVLFDLALKYEQWRATSGQPEAAKLKVSEIFRSLLMNFGHSDTSGLLVSPDGAVEPSKEFDLMLNGLEVHPSPGENLIGHLIEHILQRQSPKLQEGLATGKVNPEVVVKLDRHIEETMLAIRAIMANPLAAAKQKLGSMVMQPSYQNEQNPQSARA